MGRSLIDLPLELQYVKSMSTKNVMMINSYDNSTIFNQISPCFHLEQVLWAVITHEYAVLTPGEPFTN